MYSDSDYNEIDRRIRRNWAVWLLMMAALIAAYIVCLKRRVEWLSYVVAVALAVAGWFGFAFYQLPCLRYRGFLRDLRDGLSREMTGKVVSVSDRAKTQDGARVLPVRLLLEDEDDERIVYLNASKRELFPPAGARVKLKLCGRHIREAERL